MIKYTIIIAIFSISFMGYDAYSSHIRVVDKCKAAYQQFSEMQQTRANAYLLGKTKQGDILGEINNRLMFEIELACKDFYIPESK